MIDSFMLSCYNRGLKLIIALHDRNSLGTWDTDAYALAYGADSFYTDSTAQTAFDNRVRHILAHKNPYFGNRTCSTLSEVVFAFEPENESFGHMSTTYPSWLCTRAALIRSLLPSASPILVASGGGVDFPTSLLSDFFSCDPLDIVAVHSYYNDAASYLSSAVTTATVAGKRLVYE
ncbi:hypothetical protein HK405_008965, partial [Cladochytrium tenue]